MNDRFITDTDFLPIEKYEYLYYIKERRNNQQEELYQLIMGILIYRNIDDIYHLLMTLSVNQESAIIRNVKLKLWKDELQAIITSIKKYRIKNYQVHIVLPYLIYNTWLGIETVISYFQWAINIIDEIQNFNERLVLNKETNLCFPLPDMNYFFCRFVAEKLHPNWQEDESLDNLSIFDAPINIEKMRTDGMFNIEIELWYDEMIRRGFVKTEHCKSKFYNSEEKNYRKFFIDIDIKNEELDIIDSVNLKHNTEDVSDKEKTAVIYYMLQNKVENDIIIKVCNYVLGKKYNQEIHKKNTNNVERYIRHYRKEKLDKDNINKSMIEKVSKILSDYEMEIPQNVKDFIE